MTHYSLHFIYRLDVAPPFCLPHILHLRIPPSDREIDPSYYNHLRSTCTTGHISASSNRYIIIILDIYCATMFCSTEMYFSSKSQTAFRIASTSGGYWQLPPAHFWGFFPVIRLATWWWKLPRVLLKQGVTTNASDTRRRISWTTAR